MSTAEPNDNTAMHDRIAPDYDSIMARSPGNAWVRGAFHDLVRSTVPTGSLLLDFGCGTGTDALWYVEQGYRVLAYDNSAGMMDQLRQKAAREIATGSIVPFCAAPADFAAALRDHGSPRAIVSNFGVLNQIRDLEPLFRDFAERVLPSGWAIINVLNPFFWREIILPKWWLPALRDAGQGFVDFTRDGIDLYRHFPSRLVQAARPGFVRVGQASVGTFLRYSVGDPAWDDPRGFGQSADHRYWRSFPVRNLGKFVFLVFQRAA